MGQRGRRRMQVRFLNGGGLCARPATRMSHTGPAMWKAGVSHGVG
eukprot:CAMPEP_0183435164 /NCGR_PEP_ID=MMETSP0370-20130417/66694_1 /TAXON_ID=268820 /ORGANISM="Peridinium aciculiferum, Strain PAER-2" /LENGTH=44 /DNA_ID= /DNA_START= /DNA_END= /DNA_ORIENTATION=